jgi:hypothetical protein
VPRSSRFYRDERADGAPNFLQRFNPPTKSGCPTLAAVILSEAKRSRRTCFLKLCGYSIFDSGVYRIDEAKWLFPQEKATFDALVMSTSEAKML